ncbi:MAG TPA: hypothetical protein VF896_13310, partial [Anaerolineales bacterium]
MKIRYILVLLILMTPSCTLSSAGQGPSNSATQSAEASSTLIGIPHTETLTPIPATETLIPTLTSSPFPTDTITPSPLPIVESLKAKVTADLLSCRYGPGAEYLYLYALRAGAN